MLAALDDCTEEVRYQAAIALCEAAGNLCQHCDRTGCCSASVMSKLEEMAHGQDEKGCFKETSSRVRAAAENVASSRPIQAGTDCAGGSPAKEGIAHPANTRRAGAAVLP